MRELLQDTILFEFNAQQINESIKNNNGKLMVSGILQRADTQNQNGRVYPKNILEREAKKYETFITQRRALGELDHPDSSVINLKNVSHNIAKIYWDGDDLMGEVEILSTPSGNILKELFKSGIKLGISSRGLGSVKQVEEGNMVQDDFDLLGWDFVSNPSTHGAFMGSVNESVNLEENVCNTYCRSQSLIREILAELES